MPKTAYELEREANIARNRALLEQLELKEAVAELGMPAKHKASPQPKTRAKPVQPGKRKRNRELVQEPPRRQSSRLRGWSIDPNESPEKRRKREQEAEVRRKKEEEERLAAEERAREARKPRHQDLDLTSLAASEEYEAGELSGLTTLLQSASSSSLPRGVAKQDTFVFEDDKTEAREMVALRKRVQGLTIVARAKVTQDRIYSAAYHPEPTKDLIFFGDKHGQLGIWDPRAHAEEVMDEDDAVVDSATKESGKNWRLQAHWPATSQSSISCIKFDPIDSHSVYTSAYDCTIRSLSFTSGISREVFSTEDVLITSIDLPPAGHEMWISDAGGGVTHLDLRQDKSKARWYQLADQKIGCVSHGALDFDSGRVAKFLSSKNGKSTLRADWPHGKSVSSAYWDPRGRTVVSTSYDDTLRLWDINPSNFAKDAAFPKLQPSSRIRHNCQTGKWLTILKAQWSPNPDVYPHFTIGNMNHSVDIYSCKGDVLAKLHNPALISAVQAVTCSHPSVVERVASGNASGRCVLWAPPDED
ncbi:hypothetical protein EW146_g8923 [Bondarzewia mesenterica]|uniref:DNA damage-binding protein CMR1 n=1 Tax=Bondarzewia mesenterica TaxID=1095465 RepID=A0A4S4LFV2_9AGAM|nr:hypothetical protein EW146_g8923 [Bondarzewia mesenterica]